MKNLNYLCPILFSISNIRIIIKGRSIGRSIGIIRICADALPMLNWNYSYTSICFNPKKIQKVPDRKRRKACYQAFALYKKSFEPIPKLKLKIWRDEWPRLMKRATQTWSDHITDSFSFFAHCYKERATFAAQYECRWDLGTDLS